MAVGSLTSFVYHLRRAVLLQDGGGMSDGQLLQSFLSCGEEAAFAALVQRHGPMVLGVCRRVLQNTHDAEDAFQATFVVLLRKAASILPREYVGNWLYGVAYRTALKARTMAAKRRFKESQVRTMPKREAFDSAVWHDLQPVLDQELNRLPDKYRLPVVLCDLEGKSRKEVARQLGWPEGTVSGRLARARQMLARRLGRYGVALSGGALAALIGQNAAAAAVPAGLLANTLRAAALSRTGTILSTGVMSAKVASLAEGVVKSMLITKLKIATVLLAVIALIGLGTGLFAQRLLGEQGRARLFSRDAPAHRGSSGGREGNTGAKKAKNAPKLEDPGKGKNGNGQALVMYTGLVAAISQDHKQLTLALLPQRKGEQPRTKEIKLSGKTELAYFGIGPDGARPTKGYQAKIWLEQGSADTAARIYFKSKAGAKKLPHLSSRVVAVSKDGKEITLALPSKKIKGKKPKETKQIKIRFTDKTVLTFANVGKDGAKPAENYLANVWLEKNSKDTAAAVVFNGGKEAKPKKGVALKPADQPREKAGTVVAVSSDAKTLTVDIYPPKKKGEKPKKPERIDIKIDDKTDLVFYAVGPGGAQPAEGLRVQAWLQEGSNNRAAKLRFTRLVKRKVVAGTVVALGDDGKTLTLELPRTKKKRAEPVKMEIKLTGDIDLVYSGVGPGEARPAKGYHARVVFKENSPDAPEVIILEKALAKKLAK
jgi:RNA polymerase sigma factor (sigma-70 family)